jgi:hypothetical protein
MALSPAQLRYSQKWEQYIVSALDSLTIYYWMSRLFSKKKSIAKNRSFEQLTTKIRSIELHGQ